MGFPGKTSFGSPIRSVALLACIMATVGCKQDEPSPTRVTKTVVQTPTTHDPTPSRFPNPEYEPPGAREGDQLPADELEAALAEGRRHLDAKDHSRAAIALRPCANRTPQDATCELLLGAATAYQRRRRGEARYYLEQGLAAAKGSPLPPALLNRAGRAAQEMSAFELAADAFQLAIAAGDAGADAYARLAEVLQGVPDRRDEAIAALQRAVDLDPTVERRLFDLATLVAQTEDTARAKKLFETYLERFDGTDAGRTAAAKRRIPELSAKEQVLAGKAPQPDTPSGDGP